MNWTHFPWIFGSAALCWALASCLSGKWLIRLAFAGTVVVAAFIAGLWWSLDRPPMRTLGETRLWFGLLLPASGLLIHRFVPWKWPLVVSTGMALLFLGITLAKPETHDRTLMPALQSPWFVPHVVIYMMAYAFLCHTALTSICYTWISRKNPGRAESALPIVEASLWVGFGLLTLGLLCGAVWAKEAWGHYWTWDPKETWAFLTWGCYLLYFHLQPVWRKNPRSALLFLAIASVTVFLCWFAVNAMPSAAQSVHTYTG